MADKEKKIVTAESDTLVDTLRKHVSFDGIYREPGGNTARYIIPKGKEIPKHVIVINEEKPAEPPKKEKSAGKEKVEFKSLDEAGKLKEIAACTDAEQLTTWGVDLDKDSKLLKAITDRIQEIELGNK